MHPTQEQLKKFVQSRLNPVLDKTYFRDIVNWDKDSLGYKQIRNSSLFFRTSSKPGSVEGVDKYIVHVKPLLNRETLRV